MTVEFNRDLALSELLDKAAIRDVIERYFHALDSRDGDAMRSCFAAESRVQFHTGTKAQFQRGGVSFAEFLIEGFGRHKNRTHLVGSLQIELNGDTAKTRTQAVAFLVSHDDKGEVRGLLYEDNFVKVDGAWKIDFRKHTPRWQFSVDIETPTAFQWAVDFAESQSKS